MKAPTLSMLLVVGAALNPIILLGQIGSDGLKIDLHTSASRVHLKDHLVLSLFFRSPDKEIRVWDAFGWGPSAGLHLQIADSSGHEIPTDFFELFHPLPPRSGDGSQITIGRSAFAGFDSGFPVKLLFPKPGRYVIKAIYKPPLPRNYFLGNPIWGEEDGQIESPRVKLIVKK
jgi:hypothetical protein